MEDNSIKYKTILIAWIRKIIIGLMTLQLRSLYRNYAIFIKITKTFPKYLEDTLLKFV